MASTLPARLVFRVRVAGVTAISRIAHPGVKTPRAPKAILPQRVGHCRHTREGGTPMTPRHSHEHTDPAAADGEPPRQALRIVRATHLGMCFGVRDAIALALEHADAG